MNKDIEKTIEDIDFNNEEFNTFSFENEEDIKKQKISRKQLFVEWINNSKKELKNNIKENKLYIWIIMFIITFSILVYIFLIIMRNVYLK